ncbi:hypothetical protein [Chromobacterium vaccinii]|uniref:hypothetical protein n=1 Tax=Chromobacterium vaccinii TaxID=1108595 RepID=UPI000E129F25|nr:hypothetical protein [Chromobacterium vaccinii]SUX55049.1 Uncharacterised protein [Chromobacterium vaccinii]
MSILDQQFGERLGEMRGQAAERADRTRDNYAWQAFSNSLQARLEDAEESRVFVQAQLDAQTAMLRKMTDELRRLDSSNPLLNVESQKAYKAQIMADSLAKNGYSYDTLTFKVSKLRR